MKLCARLRCLCAAQVLLILGGTALGLYLSSLQPTCGGIVLAVLLWRYAKGWHCGHCGKPVVWDSIPVASGNVSGWTLFFSSRCRTCHNSVDVHGTRAKNARSTARHRPWERSFGPVYLWLFCVLAAAVALLDFWGRLPMGAPGDVSGAQTGF